jgi:hypothetical protein
MASKFVIKLRAYDSHALKCAALAAAMKDDIVLDKVPLATPLKGVPLLATAAGEDICGSNEICDFLIKSCTPKEGVETLIGNIVALLQPTSDLLEDKREGSSDMCRHTQAPRTRARVQPSRNGLQGLSARLKRPPSSGSVRW